MKKLFIISILAIGCVNNLYAGSCGIPSLDSSIGGTMHGCQSDSTGSWGKETYNASNYGITTDSTWAAEFSYGTVWGIASCNNTNGGTIGTVGTPTLVTKGKYCWCQATGFTASGNSYTSGPQCTTSASSSWGFYTEYTDNGYCDYFCACNCGYYVRDSATLRASVFGVAGYVPPSVELNWYNNGTVMSGGPSSCVVGGTFVPPTPPARDGYIFVGWKVKDPTCGINQLDTSIAGRGTSYYGYTSLNGNAGSNESNYGLAVGSGQWATEFSYGTVWGMAKCSTTSGNSSSYTWPESSKSDWLKTPSDTNGQYCWCQVTGFTASGNSYTSGPQCTTTASSLWVFNYGGGSSDLCARNCARSCASYVRGNAAFRAGVFGAVGQ
jgi:hypothetical protein